MGCDPSCAAAGGTCSASACTLTENPGGASTTTQTTLHGSGTSDAAFAWLYPYDRTVFPRGLVSPTMQFAGGGSDTEYVHITSANLDYKGYFAGGAQGAVKLALSHGGIAMHQRPVRPAATDAVGQEREGRGWGERYRGGARATCDPR